MGIDIDEANLAGGLVSRGRAGTPGRRCNRRRARCRNGHARWRRRRARRAISNRPPAAVHCAADSAAARNPGTAAARRRQNPPRRSRAISPRSRNTCGARFTCRTIPSSYGRIPMLDGAPTTPIARAMAVRTPRRDGRGRAASVVGTRTTFAPLRPIDGSRRPAAAPAGRLRSSRAPTRSRAMSGAG